MSGLGSRFYNIKYSSNRRVFYLLVKISYLLNKRLTRMVRKKVCRFAVTARPNPTPIRPQNFTRS